MDRGAAEALHEGHAEAAEGDGFGDDFVDAEFIEAAEAVEEAEGGLGEFAAAGAEDEDVVPFGEVEEAVFGVAAVAEEGVALAGFGVKILGIFYEAEGGGGGVVVGELAGDFGGGGGGGAGGRQIPPLRNPLARHRLALKFAAPALVGGENYLINHT